MRPQRDFLSRQLISTRPSPAATARSPCISCKRPRSTRSWICQARNARPRPWPAGRSRSMAPMQRLDPRDPYLAVRLLHVACGLYFCSEYEASIEASKRLIRSYPDFPMIYRWPAAALGQLGRTAEAKEALEKAVSRAPAAFDMYVRK